MLKKINKKNAVLSVMGLGYVGLPLAVEFAKTGFKVIGLDVDETKIKQIENCKSYILDIADSDLEQVVKSGKLRVSMDFSILRTCDVIFICVPTPFSKFKTPDMSYIVKASKQIAANLQKNQLIILESTTHTGTTEEVVLPILEKGGLKGGEDFYLVFSPERVDPGNKKFNIKNTPKVVGGINPESTQLAKELYKYVVLGEDKIIPVSSPKVAEMTKLLENIFRSVNIALVNELTLLCDRMGIDMWEVIEAASSKPFGFMPFYPSPGVGGHCIPVDPYYLSWKAREYDFYTKFIEFAAEVNSSMPRYVVSKLIEALNEKSKSLKNSKILALGVTFKKDVNDARNSPALKVIEELVAKGANLVYHDPYVRKISKGTELFESDTKLHTMQSQKLTKELLCQQDCVIILVDHSIFDMSFIVEHSQLILDTRNCTKKISGTSRNKIMKI